MRVVLIIALAAIVLATAIAGSWARLGWHRAQAMHFGSSRCIDLELRPRGFHVSISPYDRGFPTSMKQRPGWTFMHSVNPPPNDSFITPKARFLGFGFDITDRDELYGGPAHFVNLPYWLVLGVLAAALALLLRQELRHRKRSRVGLCLGCGYDLRASTDRCPECGRAIDAGVSVATVPIGTPA